MGEVGNKYYLIWKIKLKFDKQTKNVEKWIMDEPRPGAQ
jgi:hypothetical protein